MKFYHNLSFKEKFNRTIFVGIPILIVASTIIFYLAPTTTEKIVVPLMLFIIWLIQLLYTYKKSQNPSNR